MGATGEAPVVIGRIGRPHGVTGELRVIPTGPTLATLAPGEPVTVTAPDGRARRLILEGSRAVSRGILVRLRGVGTREEAAALTAWSVSVPATRLAPLDEPDEFYVRDLIGCEVRSDDLLLGEVRDVYEGAANDALFVVDAAGRETLVPFTHDAVVALDLEGRMVRIRPDLLAGPSR